MVKRNRTDSSWLKRGMIIRRRHHLREHGQKLRGLTRGLSVTKWATEVLCLLSVCCQLTPRSPSLPPLTYSFLRHGCSTADFLGLPLLKYPAVTDCRGWVSISDLRPEGKHFDRLSRTSDGLSLTISSSRTTQEWLSEGDKTYFN